MTVHKQVRLDIRTRSLEASDQDFTQTCAGELIRRGKSWYIRYRENPENMGETTTVIKLESSQITLIRHGEVTMRQAYRLNERKRGEYCTPQGCMEMETYTEKLHVIPTTDSIDRVHWRYRLWLDQQLVGYQDIMLAIEEVEAE